MSEKSNTLSGVVADHIAAVNASDVAAIVATYADEALVNDARREFRGTDAIRPSVANEIVGDNISIEVVEVVEVVEVIDSPRLTVVRGRYNGDFDKTNIPGELILANYFTMSDGKIDSLIIISNTST